ncbi:General secretion pathway protein C [hydrothermal vent metagenome]|uniref:General secretion pathway protein C n=1 Tax=hydrothermal vent metagenome TaxID=652676 RepID=A0A1W1BUS0_9ZZZZ
MKQLFSPSVVKNLILILATMAIVKIGWVAVEMTLLPARGVEYIKNSDIKSLYYRTRFATNRVVQGRATKQPISDISSFKLLAIYRSKDVVVVTISKGGKSSVLSKKDNIDGYILDDATARAAIFLRNGKRYRLYLTEKMDSPESKRAVRYPTKTVETPKEKPASSEPIGEIVQSDDVTVIDKSLLEHYGKNLNDIWKNIGMKEVTEGGHIKGFKVNFVKRGSHFSKLGLRRGDIIKSVNGQELNSYNSAFEIYRDIDNIDSLTVVIMRGKEEMELNYEIN